MKYVVVGGDAAGMSAAMQLLKHDREAEITILEKGAYYSYAQCGMPYAISGVVASLDDLVVRSVDTLDRKSTRLNSSHVAISYAVFCLKKKIKTSVHSME